MNNENEFEMMLNIFLKEQTYTYIKVLGDNNYHLHYNGYVKKVEDKYFIFLDDELGERPIFISKLLKIDISNKKKVEEPYEKR